MAWKQIALAGALLGVAMPGEAFETRDEAQSVMFYYAFPLDARSNKERIPWLGLQVQGKRDYQSFNVDTRLFSFTEGGSAASLAIVGAVAIGAALVVGQRGKTSQQEVQQQQAANPPAPATPTNPGGNCPKTC